MKVKVTRFPLVALIALALCPALLAETESITTADGDGGDVYIKQNITTLPNNQEKLEVKNAGSVTTKSFLKFDVTPFSTRIADLESATMHLVTHFNHIGGSSGDPDATDVFVYGIIDDSIDDWDEMEVLWDNAPANVGTANDLDMEKVIPLGSFFVPANPDPDPVSFSSQALVDFIKADANGILSLVLRREDNNGAHNLRFYSKESATGRGDMTFAPTLEMELPPAPVEGMPLWSVLETEEVIPGYYESAWFGRFGFNDEFDIGTSALGTFWSGDVQSSDSMLLYSFDFKQWIWTSEAAFPYFYLQGKGWMYLHYDPGQGAYLYDYTDADAPWKDHNSTGWEYPMTEEERTQAFYTNLESVPHPRILLAGLDFSELRDKVSDGWLSDAYTRLELDVSLEQAEGTFDISYSATIGRRMQRAIATYALYGYMAEEPFYLEEAVAFTMHQLNRFTDEELQLNNAGSPHLGTGDVLHALAIAYDWLYPYFSEAERAQLRARMESIGASQVEYLRGTYDGSSIFSNSTNHNAVGNGGLGMAALALGDKTEWLDQAIRQVSNYMKYSTDDEGWNFEGRSYFGYGGWGGFPFASAVEHLGGPEIFAEYPRYERMAVDYFLRQVPPYNSTSGIAAAFPFIVRSQDRYGMWLWLNVLGENGNSSYGGAGSDISFLPYTLIWADPDLEPLSPIGSDLPLDKVFPGDRALFRDGWDPMDSVVTFTGGWTRHSGHRMRSDNSFNFYSLGERFSISPSDAQTRMEVLHSLVMVDEPRRNRHPREYPYGANFETVATDEDHAYVKSDATTSAVYYLEAEGWKSADMRKVTEAVRHILFARSPEGLMEPYLFIVDDLTAREASATFSWLFQTAAGNTVDLGTSGDSFEVVGENFGNKLEANFLAPTGLTNGILSHDGRDEIKGRWSDERINDTLTTISTQSTGKSVRFVALLQAYENGSTAPDYVFTGTETNGQLTVTLSDGTVDVITINGDEITFVRTDP